VLQFLLVCFLAEGMTKDDTFCLMCCAALRADKVALCSSSGYRWESRHVIEALGSAIAHQELCHVSEPPMKALLNKALRSSSCDIYNQFLTPWLLGPWVVKHPGTGTQTLRHSGTLGVPGCLGAWEPVQGPTTLVHTGNWAGTECIV